MEIPFKISRTNMRLWQYYLRRRYNKPRMELSNLLRMAVQEIIADQAKKELEEIDKEWKISKSTK